MDSFLDNFGALNLAHVSDPTHLNKTCYLIKSAHSRWLTADDVVMQKRCALLLSSVIGEKTNPMRAEVTVNLSPAIRSDVSSTGLDMHDPRRTGWIPAAPLLTVTFFWVRNRFCNPESCHRPPYGGLLLGEVLRSYLKFVLSLNSALAQCNVTLR